MLWLSLEAPLLGASNEYPQHMVLWRNKKNIYLIRFLFRTKKLCNRNTRFDMIGHIRITDYL